MSLSIASQYIDDVLAGRVLACKYVKQACERQKRDLARDDLPYTFSEMHAERVCKFIQLLPHVKGRQWAGQQIKLEPWQIFLLTTVFGWVDAQGHRRFKVAYVEVPRKNAKSTLSSGIGLYMLVADGEPGAEVYSAATTRDQARIVFSDAQRMVDQCAGLRNRFGVKKFAHAISIDGNGSTFKALSRDQGGNLDGLNVHCAIIDELHAHKTRDVYDVIETATGARQQPLLWLITTSGFNRAGICYEQRAYSLKLLDQVISDEEYFSIVYTIDEGDDWTRPETWQKANPNWGISVNPEDIARKARKAMEMAAAQNNFLTKHLNCWVNADTAWMDMLAWERCADTRLSIDDFEGCRCWVGLDLASKTDIAALLILFERGGEYAVFGRYYLPEDAAEDGRNSQYGGWAIEGRLTTTPGNVTDYAYIEDELRELASRFDIAEVAYDPWQAQYLANRLQQDGMPIVEYRQTVQNMSEPMKELEALVLKRELKHDGCPVLSWMISNVVAHLDAKENIYPRKEFPENKIDGVVALIMALGRAIAEQQPQPSVYEQRGILQA